MWRNEIVAEWEHYLSGLSGFQLSSLQDLSVDDRRAFRVQNHAHL